MMRVGSGLDKKFARRGVMPEPQGILVNAQCLSTQIFLARATDPKTAVVMFSKHDCTTTKLLVTRRRLFCFALPNSPEFQKNCGCL